MKNIRPILVLLLLAASVGYSHAGPASQEPVEIVQPDGSKLTILMHGDEFFHWATTIDGYTLLLNDKGYYEYAQKDEHGNLVLSGIIARNASARSGQGQREFSHAISKGEFYSENQLSQIKQMVKVEKEHAMSGANVRSLDTARLILFLVEFPDVPFTYTKEDFEKLMNQPDYTENGYTGSVFDYFKDNSCGKFILKTTVLPIYRAKNNLSYYGGKGNSKIYELLSDVIKARDSIINYANYDLNADGAVDAVYMIYSGLDQAMSFRTQDIWAAASNLPTPVTCDGVRLQKFAMSAEKYGNIYNNTFTGIGTICHEYSHLLGISDLYDSDNESSGGVSYHAGFWDVMAQGSLNNKGRTPPIHNGFTRDMFGWQKLIEITDTLPLYMPKMEIGNQETYQAYKIATVNSAFDNTEYFMLENRQKVKWNISDSVPGTGLLITHIDETWMDDNNCWNCTPGHEAFRIVPSDGNFNKTNNRLVVPFNSAAGRNRFTNTTPAKAISHQGTYSPLIITNIEEDDGNLTVHFAASPEPDIVECNNASVTKLIENFDFAIQGTFVNTDSMESVSKAGTSQWKETVDGELKYASVRLNSEVGEQDVWLISREKISKDIKQKSLMFSFMTADTNRKIEAAVYAVQCRSYGKAYLQRLTTDDSKFPFKITPNTWTNTLQTLVPVKNDFFILFRMKGAYSASKPMMIGIDSIRINPNGEVNVQPLPDDTATTAINEITENAAVELFPNPAINKVHITADKEIAEIQFVDVNGKIFLFKNAFGKEAELNLKQLVPGAYIVRLTYKDKTQSVAKLIKK